MAEKGDIVALSNAHKLEIKRLIEELIKGLKEETLLLQKELTKLSDMESQNTVFEENTSDDDIDIEQ